MSDLVLIDNTVLTNFALINRPGLVLNLWPGGCTTPSVQAEYQAGIATRQLPAGVWDALAIITLTPEEEHLAARQSQQLGTGERTCIAAALYRRGLFASDDADARRQAQVYGIPVTGTIGVLLLNIQQRRINLDEGNALLAQMIILGYRAPVSKLDDYV